jgi:glycosyltransferase involved in cell wall biosynthesis
MKDPLVSICCLTYNHEPYIRQCIEGFLIQKTTFPIEILIHDDASTDNTADIIREYEAKFPNIIKPIYQIENQYSKGVGVTRVFQFPRSKGKYIAMCEGDDYWIDPLKLQKQVDFLEQNPDYGLVHTNCEGLNKGKIQPMQNSQLVKSGYVFNDLLCQTFFISTLTVCVKADQILKWSKILEKEFSRREWKMGDYPLWLEGSLHTKFGFLNDVTAHYRIMSESASHSKDIIMNLRFFQSVYDIKQYFITKERVDAQIANNINIQYNKVLLRFAFYLNNRSISGIAFKFLKQNGVRYTKLDYVYYYGTKSKFLNFLLNCYRKLKIYFH